MRLIPLALILAPFALASCSAAEEPTSAPTEAVAPALHVAPAASADPAADPALATAIANTLGEDAASTRTVVRIVGEGPGRVALVYLVGMNWCGSGGCSLLILRPGAAGWEEVGNVARVSNPVRLLTTSSNGLPDIGVTVSGGGGPAPYEARVSFDGQSYPRFPSDEALVGADGTVVITDDDLPPPSE
ncbi:hypothetical protein [Brevundimonas sp.]|uniref:hypothetical protein n=1 Tax=Brevundimonas sp. TaxID=1871086 RepID=UPI0026179203|nr:hypothetical protein [Brevundimonas sp.]